MNLTKTRNTTKYLAIKELSDENKTYSISALCEFAGIARSAYYKWLGHVNSDNDNLNERIANTITKIHDEHPDMGYRRIRDTLAHDYKIAVNDKRVLRICRKKKIQSYIKHRYNCCTKPASDPAYVAENILNREFKSDMINQKWVTDVSEFKYGVGEDDKKGKLYLSVILDLCDRRPVAFVYSTRNDNPLVFDTFDKAVAANPGATPLLHSDRGYQYTSKAFRRRILAAGMTQSMSRVARCIDNGPMEGFWGLMKREMYYGKKYKTKEELMLAIEKYIDYAPYGLMNGYGMTEMAGPVCTSNHKFPVMLPFFCNNIKILDIDTGEELGYDKEGEICVSGPSMMLEYYKNPEATREIIFEENGTRWLRTGDLGHVTKEGYFRLTGRLKRILWSIGADKTPSRVYPMEIENVLSRHSAVDKCAVVGRLNGEKGYLVIAYVTLKSKDIGDNVEKELRQLCRQELKENSWPFEYHFVEKLPTTGAGKIDFRTLEKWAENSDSF